MNPSGYPEGLPSTLTDHSYSISDKVKGCFNISIHKRFTHISTQNRSKESCKANNTLCYSICITQYMWWWHFTEWVSDRNCIELAKDMLTVVEQDCHRSVGECVSCKPNGSEKNKLAYFSAEYRKRHMYTYVLITRAIIRKRFPSSSALASGR